MIDYLLKTRFSKKNTNGQLIRIKEIHVGAPVIRVTFNIVYSVYEFVNDNSCNKKGHKNLYEVVKKAIKISFLNSTLHKNKETHRGTQNMTNYTSRRAVPTPRAVHPDPEIISLKSAD